MNERRHVAGLLTFVVAGLAVAGTSAATPPPGPAQPLAVSGSVHLSAEQPVAIQPLVFVVGQGELASLTLTPTITDAPDHGSMIVSVEVTDQTGTRLADPATGLASDPPTSKWSFTCRANPCDARYALVVTWVDAPAGEAADVAWTIDAIATYRGSVPAGATPGQVTLSAPVDGSLRPDAVASRATSGEPIRLGEADRFRSWTITLRRTDAVRSVHGWPTVTQARLAVSASQVAGAPFTVGQEGQPEDTRVRTRVDPPVQLRVTTSDGRSMAAWASARPIDFDPFSRCSGEAPCETTLTVEMAWADGRPDTTFDAAWTLDVVSVDATGKATPVTTNVAGPDRIHVATATASGTFDEPGVSYQPAVRFTVAAPTLPDLAGQVQRVPASARITVTASSVGPVPLPADAVISVFADGGYAGLATNVLIHPGETSSFAFEPTGVCGTGLSAQCSARGTLGAVIYTPNRNTANVEGMVVRIDWTIEAGVGTVDGGTAVVNVEPQPTRRP